MVAEVLEITLPGETYDTERTNNEDAGSPLITGMHRPPNVQQAVRRLSFWLEPSGVDDALQELLRTGLLR
jgi:hypothetical protein